MLTLIVPREHKIDATNTVTNLTDNELDQMIFVLQQRIAARQNNEPVKPILELEALPQQPAVAVESAVSPERATMTESAIPSERRKRGRPRKHPLVSL